MNTETMIEILQAHLDGKQVQCRRSSEHPWIDVAKDSTPMEWSWMHWQWRIKPETEYMYLAPVGANAYGLGDYTRVPETEMDGYKNVIKVKVCDD